MRDAPVPNLSLTHQQITSAAAPPSDLLTKTDQTRWYTNELAPHEPALRAYLHGLVPPSDIDDVVQESLIRLLRVHRHSLVISPRGLLFAIARNAARDLFRRQSTAKTFPIADVEVFRVLDDAPSAAEITSRRQEADLLNQAIAELPPRCREILILRKFETLSHREIAQRLGIAEHTVEAQLTKALHRCETYFVQHGAMPLHNR